MPLVRRPKCVEVYLTVAVVYDKLVWAVDVQGETQLIIETSKNSS